MYIPLGFRILRSSGAVGEHGQDLRVTESSGADIAESCSQEPTILNLSCLVPAPTAMVACLARGRLRARLWKGTLKHRCQRPPVYDLTPHRALDLADCMHFQKIWARRRRRLRKIAVRCYELAMVDGNLLFIEIAGWQDDEIEMEKQSKLTLTTFF